MAISSQLVQKTSDNVEILGRVPTVRIRPTRGFFHLDLAALWQYRELLYFLVWRDVKVRYKQTVIGVGWAIFQPLLTMLIFTAIFNYVAKIPSDGVPYPLFAYAALLPWTFVSQAITRSSTSLVGEAQLVSKVYFPRLVIPLAAALAPAVDLLCAFLMFVAFLAWYGIVPGWQAAFLPLFVLEALVVAVAVSLWFSALNVQYRDVGHAIPFFVQFWMFASPVVYPISVVPEAWRPLYSLNPMVSIIEGFRWALLGTKPPAIDTMAVSVTMVVALLLGGLVYFRRMERTFADVI